MKQLTKISLTILMLFTMAVNGIAQNEGNIWYFGVNAGIDFNGGSPVALINGQMPMTEGCSSISDGSGNILFYTNGVDVWNKNHTIMTNGSGLDGGYSITQSAIIVPKPSSSTIFYIFTTNPVQGLKYSEIDMNLSSGLGSVTANKNILIHGSSSEKLTAVRHQNGIDYWLLSHELDSDTFNTYLVSSSGINLTSVISSTGSVISSSNDGVGYMKASPNGTLLALANFGIDEVQIFDFDNSTGILSNPTTLTNYLSYGPYGLEFSSSNDILYVTDANDSLSNVYQYDLTAPDINSSKILLTTLQGYTGAMQLGPNGKIYMCITDSNFLSVIDSPNILGVSCNFILNGFNLGGKQSFIGLPSFPNDIYSFLSSVNELQSSHIDIFPNPVNEILTIQTTYGHKIDIRIYNLSGQIVYERNDINSNLKINVSSINNGLYIMKVHSEEDSTSIIKKLIINH